MKIECPHGCGAKFSMSTKVCPGCGKPAEASDFIGQKIRSVWHGAWGGKEHVLKANCPHCREPFPLNSQTCPTCGQEVGAVPMIREYATPILATAISIRRRADNITPFQGWVVRLSYFLGSFALLGLLLKAAEGKFVNGNGNWITAGLATVVYLGFSLLILTWILPKNIGPALARLKVLVKLSLFLNYISTVFAIMFITDHWRARSGLLIAALFITMLALWFSSRFILPFWITAGTILSGQYGQTPPDPAYRGGRRQDLPDRYS